MKTLPIILLAFSLTQTTTAQEEVIAPETPCETSTYLTPTLEAAIRSGDVETVKRLMPKDGREDELYSCLQTATAARQADIIELIVRTRTDEEEHEFISALSLYKAYLSGDMAFLQDLLARKFGDPARALEAAAENGDIPAIGLLLEAGADIHARDERALCAAALMGQEETVRFLLDKGAAPNHHPAECDEDDWGMDTPLSWAIMPDLLFRFNKGDEETWRKKIRIAKLLVERGADMSSDNLTLGVSTLLAFAGYCPAEPRREILDFLLRSGMDPDIVREKDGATIIMLATYHAPDSVLRLIQAGANINVRDNEGKTPLMWATRSINWAAVENLLQAGADIFAKDLDGDTAVDYASELPNGVCPPEIFQLFRDAEQKAGQASPDDDAALEAAIRAGDAGAVRGRLDEMAQEGRAPWHYLQQVIETQNAGIIRLIIEALPPAPREFAHERTLEHAIRLANPQFLKELADSGCCTLDEVFRGAVRIGDLKLGEYLIGAGADLQQGLDCALRQARVDFVALLLDKGADPNEDSETYPYRSYEAVFHQDSDDDEAPDLPKRRRDIVKLLLAHGLEVNPEGGNRWTPLMLAALHGDTEMLRIILDAGADINTQEDYGQTALMCAMKHGHDEAAQLLIQAGADTTLRDSNGNTAQMLKEKRERHRKSLHKSEVQP